jgi:hypothetical protein
LANSPLNEDDQNYAESATVENAALLAFFNPTRHDFLLGIAAQIVWSEVVQLRPFGTPPNHVPDDAVQNNTRR